jgi:hypothetical protein
MFLTASLERSAKGMAADLGFLKMDFIFPKKCFITVYLFIVYTVQPFVVFLGIISRFRPVRHRIALMDRQSEKIK